MKPLLRAFAIVLLGSCCCAQTAKISDLQNVGGFLDFCGLKPDQLSKVSTEAITKAPPGKVMDAIKQGMSDKVADHAMCLSYVTGVYEGWKEGHDHGVFAVYFPAGVPDKVDLSMALKSLSSDQLDAASAALKNDLPCMPEHITVGEMQDAVVKYLNEQAVAHLEPFSRVLSTSRMIPEAIRKSFPCSTAKPAIVQPGSPKR